MVCAGSHFWRTEGMLGTHPRMACVMTRPSPHTHYPTVTCPTLDHTHLTRAALTQEERRKSLNFYLQSKIKSPTCNLCPGLGKDQLSTSPGKLKLGSLNWKYLRSLSHCFWAGDKWRTRGVSLQVKKKVRAHPLVGPSCRQVKP